MDWKRVGSVGSRIALAAGVLVATQVDVVAAAIAGHGGTVEMLGMRLNPSVVLIAYVIWVVNAALATLLGLRLRSLPIAGIGITMFATAVATLVGWSSVLVAAVIVAMCAPSLMRAANHDKEGEELPFSRFESKPARRKRRRPRVETSAG